MKKGTRKQFCKYGHDTFICGRDKKRQCKECKKEYNHKTHEFKKRFCPNEHDTLVCGRYNNGQCKQCRKEHKQRWIAKSKEKINTYAKEYYKKHLESNRKSKLKTGYRITLEDYDNMFQEQEGRCAGCQRLQSEFTRAFGVDHDHKCCSGKRSCGKCVRGLLCPTCNRLLGQIVENSDTLQRLASYLDNYK